MSSFKESFSRAESASLSISPELGSGNGRSLQEIPSIFVTEAQSAPSESGSVVGGHSGNISESGGSDESYAPKGKFAKLAEKGDIDRGYRGRWSDYSEESEESGVEGEEGPVYLSEEEEKVAQTNVRAGKPISLLTEALRKAPKDSRVSGEEGQSNVVNQLIIVEPLLVVDQVASGGEASGGETSGVEENSGGERRRSSVSEIFPIDL